MRSGGGGPAVGCGPARWSGRPSQELLTILAGRLFRTALGSLFSLTLLLTLLRLASRRPLPAGSLLRSRLLSRGIRLRLVTGRRRRLHRLLRPLPAGSLLRSRLLSRGIGLRLGPRWLRSPSTLGLSTLDGRTVLAGRRRRLCRLLTLRARGRRRRLLTLLLTLPRGSGRLRMHHALGFRGCLHSAG